MMNGLQNIIGGLLAFGFSFVPSTSPIKSWQALFMSYGIITVIWAIFVFFWLPDSIMRAKCWSEEDKRLMVERVRQNQTGLQNRIFKWEQVREAFTDPQRKCSDHKTARYMLTNFSLRIRSHPTINHHSLWRYWCLCQHYRQLIRLQHLGESTPLNGRRSRHSHHHGILRLP